MSGVFDVPGESEAIGVRRIFSTGNQFLLESCRGVVSLNVVVGFDGVRVFVRVSHRAFRVVGVETA